MRARRYAAGAVAWVAIGLAWWVGRRRERADELEGIRARLERLESHYHLGDVMSPTWRRPTEGVGHGTA